MNTREIIHCLVTSNSDLKIRMYAPYLLSYMYHHIVVLLARSRLRMIFSYTTSKVKVVTGQITKTEIRESHKEIWVGYLSRLLFIIIIIITAGTVLSSSCDVECIY